ncbi:MAG: polysulfide reductase NrfD [Gammaproteobacteria bacterium]|nr:polysulfide reductase NrfD [Gammaproteobacteria bacterium]
MRFHPLKPARRSYRLTLAGLAALAALGAAAAHRMDAAGHHITGMNNSVVWGAPHVFALALILAASGALNAASMASVFGAPAYRPLARLSALLAAALLTGGLLILLLDLGRPERLVIALTHYNFTSVFAWNLILYAGFIGLAAAYLHALFTPPAAPRLRITAALALIWRIVLTTGSGAIFGVLVARPGYHAAMLLPLFIAMALALGGAAFALTAAALSRWHGDIDAAARAHQARLLAWFIAAQLFLTAALHLVNLYDPARADFARFVLLSGGVYTALFWAQALLGGALPLALLARGGRHLRAAAALVIGGGLAHLSVIIIGGQALPMPIFPGRRVAGALGEVAPYTPSLPELLLGLGGAATALLLLLGALRILPSLPPPGEDGGAGAGAGVGAGAGR